MSTPNTYHGSCHCGTIQYQIRLTFPPTPDPNAESIRIYKCNCSPCRKMGFFHVRPISPAADFIVTAPATIAELGDYRVNDKKIGWYFCKTCGVRPFAVAGAWEQVDLDVAEWAGKEGDGKTQKVWRTKPADVQATVEGKQVTKNMHYVSVNAVTLEPREGEGDNGVDLREWHDKGWIFYVESRTGSGGSKVRFGEPHHGGMY
ncbi:DUF636 domain protein [Massariosphaeria phaeospora]|uniref:DUF636 domain protein n=1 Tax=Massariosphaeria phaeospora TaxID=100035 RepID=A0A7C8MJ07_9PLEO|nr:DUF636 domain protein [Massariosphaeria phaeospora]